MKRNPTICSNIKSAWHAIARLYNEQAGKYGITSSIGFVLLNIDKDEGTPATKIAPNMGMDAHSLTRILKSLEENNYIIRKQDDKDKRMVRVYLTDKGRIAKDHAKRVVRKLNDYIKQEIPQDQLLTFITVLEQINTIVNEKKIYE